MSTGISGLLYPYPVSLGKSICRAPVKSRYAAKFYTCCMPYVTINNLKKKSTSTGGLKTIPFFWLNWTANVWVKSYIFTGVDTIEFHSSFYPDVQMYCTRKQRTDRPLLAILGCSGLNVFFAGLKREGEILLSLTPVRTITKLNPINLKWFKWWITVYDLSSAKNVKFHFIFIAN